MEFSAVARYVRISPRKLGLLTQGISQLKPTDALVRLEHINKSGAPVLYQVIASALANAKTQNVSSAELIFNRIEVLPGSAMKRFRAVSRGMAHTYKKRMSHVRVVLTTKVQVKTLEKNIKELEVKKS